MPASVSARGFRWTHEAHQSIVQAESIYGFSLENEDMVLLFPERPKIRGKQVLVLLDYLKMQHRGRNNGHTIEEIRADEYIVRQDERAAVVPHESRFRNLVYSLSRALRLNLS